MWRSPVQFGRSHISRSPARMNCFDGRSTARSGFWRWGLLGGMAEESSVDCVCGHGVRRVRDCRPRG